MMRAHYLTRGKNYILMLGAKIVGITEDKKEAELFVRRGGTTLKEQD